MRLRQIALVARELDPVVADLCAVLGVEVGFNDPGVKFFGLCNAVMPVGDTFLEVVSPIEKNTTAGRYLERMGGDAGYMVLLQTEDFDGDRKRLDELGVRIVWNADLDDIRAMHLHPRDTGGTLCSIDEPSPPNAWRWGGPDWPKHVRTETSQQLAGAVLQSPDPAALARRWGQVFAQRVTPLDDGSFEIRLEPGVLRFEAGADERLAGFSVACNDRERAFANARERDLRVDERGIHLCGVRIELV